MMSVWRKGARRTAIVREGRRRCEKRKDVCRYEVRDNGRRGSAR